MIDTGSLQLSTQRSQSGRASVPLRNAKGKKKLNKHVSAFLVGSGTLTSCTTKINVVFLCPDWSARFDSLSEWLRSELEILS